MADVYSPQFPMPLRKTGLATAALVLGLLSIPAVIICIGPLMGFVALVLGIVALVLAGTRPAVYGGAGRAVIGVVCGALTSVVLIVVVVVAITTGAVVNVARDLARSSVPVVRDLSQVFVTQARLAVLAGALQEFEKEHGVPPADIQELLGSAALRNQKFHDLLSGTEGLVFVLGVSRDDPIDWIRAYARMPLLSQSRYGLLLNDGQLRDADEQEFRRLWSNFAADYEKERGSPPTTQPADLGDDSAATPSAGTRPALPATAPAGDEGP